MTDNDQDMEAILGELAKFSEYKVGEIVRYRSPDTGELTTGEIMWISPPGQTVMGTQHPTAYWIDGLTCIYQSDIEGLV